MDQRRVWRSSALPLEVIGTKVSDLVTPCGRPHPVHTSPPDPDVLPGFAVALSGGGFRATLASIGVLRFLADAALLGRVRYVSSVSGGSIANGILASHYETLAKEGFSPEAFKRTIQDPTIE